MSHTSVPLTGSPIEFINIEEINPLISKVCIKVCYVGDEPNRNHSIITKDVARDMAKSLPGCPIVGYYNEATEDFEEHNRIIDISNGKITVKDTTKPYGFVDLNAKVWFQKFVDDDEEEREYLCTEGYLWTDAFPEAKRVISDGNNQSMELDPKTLNASWVKTDNEKPKFFIINEALISKLCILGEDVEPCFEGATITKFQLSFEQEFKDQLFAMIQKVTKFLEEKEGEGKVYTTYAVEIGDALWSAIYDYLYKTYPVQGEDGCVCGGSKYRIEGIYEEDGKKFTILVERENPGKYYRLDFSITEGQGVLFSSSLTEVTKTFVPAQAPQFELAQVEAYEEELNKSFNSHEENLDNSNQEETSENDDTTEETNSSEEGEENNNDSEGEEEPEQTEGEAAPTYSLEDIPEYVELSEKFSTLETQFNSLQANYDTLNAEVETLRKFKSDADRKDKQAMINSFYMLSDEDKKDVIENIDKYSVDDIEAKLSIICVRNKVSFQLDEDPDSANDTTTYNLNDHDAQDDLVPAWVKAAKQVEKELN